MKTFRFVVHDVSGCGIWPRPQVTDQEIWPSPGADRWRPQDTRWQLKMMWYERWPCVVSWQGRWPLGHKGHWEVFKSSVTTARLCRWDLRMSIMLVLHGDRGDLLLALSLVLIWYTTRHEITWEDAQLISSTCVLTRRRRVEMKTELLILPVRCKK